jgi:DNA-binding transcriptional regulator GbsR (MarR family)
MLMYFGIIDYVRFSGDRKRYFRLNQSTWDSLFSAQIQELSNLRELVREVIELRSEKYPDTNQQISNFYQLLEIYENEFPTILENWKQKIKQ